MNQPFQVPGFYQGRANSLPSRAAQAGTVYASGQHQDMLGPWVDEAGSIQNHYGTHPLSADAAGKYHGGGYFVPGPHDPVGDLIRSDMASASSRQAAVDASQTLNLSGVRRSGSLGRQYSVNRTAAPVRPGALHTYSNAPVLGAAGTGDDSAWYTNPWVLGAGAAAVLAGVWFLTGR